MKIILKVISYKESGLKYVVSAESSKCLPQAVHFKVSHQVQKGWPHLVTAWGQNCLFVDTDLPGQCHELPTKCV